MGSVKDLIVLREARVDEPGIGRFVFSDRYSVFDWGEMPDHIRGKGASICIVTAFFFEKLEEMGVRSHYLGIVEDGRLKRLKELKSPQNTLEFKLLRVVKPRLEGGRYDYSVYKDERGNFLIPLEVIYRNSLPEGSSVFKRLREGSLRLEDIGLREMPKPGTILDKPILDVSTKLEATDRYLSWDEAKEICFLSDGEVERIREVTLLINELITKEAKRLGLFNEDGKVEYGFDEGRDIILVDALGTLDECRFSYEGLPVSKEIARVYYRKTDWYKDVEAAKKRDRVNWKSLVTSKPPKLPPELASLISGIYMAYANEITGREWFKVPSLRDILTELKGLLGL
ncbi:MAG: phosphoribosylaminoimidazolesuccinocarboxamide synthase [Synergistetes bacterium]|nr:phosphoribosylaminoimidazolesuccinocarboxamide synthase [Synergistota bacterium]MDW8191754.1 phosphoribosylaminoimidazolesuccinocarboxamide synthase [Synergistota bacterium]